jgi:alkanesulfonate monooxygenase SsuD/methylene tetrahydromethanopterin reductase-like flavin-dependent oxidoreductase (luciferase family)
LFSIKDCGVMLEPQLGMSMDQLVATSRLAEELGFGYLFRSDHLLPTDNRRGIDSPECWTSLGAIAASTRAIKFGPMVAPVGFRNPALLARMACTLHSYSGGRLQLALGAGWYEPEYRAHGYPFPEFRGRVAQFREAFDIVMSLIREGRADYDGAYFSAHTDCLPRPSGPVHAIIGAASPSLVRIAARRADEWNLFVSPQEKYRSLKAAFDEARGEREVRVSETGPFLIGRSKEELEANAAKQARKFQSAQSPQEVVKRVRGRNAPCGTVEEFVDQLRGKADAGVEGYYFQALVPENREMTSLLADTLRGGI